ncbi:MAG: CPBP family intramembrane metalloprotease [Pirellulales bacterium]|nr:CPBP family intramembrane metalloprotease [Pirellulales bacterium]
MRFFLEAFLNKSTLLVLASLLALLAFFAVWTAIWSRRRQHRTILPYQPRRPVPWGALDLAFVVLLYLAAILCVSFLAVHFLGPEAVETPAAYEPGAESTQHAIVQLMSEGNVWVLLLCGFSAIVVAPLVEEFFFRALLQGWLESLEHRYRRRMPTLRRLPRALLPIALTSYLFAMMHFRVDGPPDDMNFTLFMQAGGAGASLLIMATIIIVFPWRTGATAADFGWLPKTLAADVRLGLTAFAAIAPPIYAMQIGLHHVFPQGVAADPIPLFFLALVLGTIFFRTHRIVPAIVLHASLNATSFLLGWLLLR